MSYNNNNTFKPKAPYRFVPLSKTIVSPHWADAVSHDIPFEDGVSGTIEVELTAHSDIFISNGKQNEEDNSDKVLEFSNFDNKYFIPSTSLKGMIRNVMEIMSFGGMKSMTQNNKYAFKPDKIFCGYLKKSNDEYLIRDCGIPGRISQIKIDEYFKTSMVKDFDRGGKYINGAGDKEKSANFKNQKYQQVINSSFLFNANNDNTGRLIADINSSGERKGRIIFTGQPGVNNLSNSQKRNGKNLEFVFFRDGNEPSRKIDKEIINNFKFAYFDHDKTRWSYDWKIWRKELYNGNEIPVFFHKDRNGKVVHLGLSYLYKLPYKHSIHDMISHTQKTDQLGFGELIFGNIKNKDFPLKGRVSFSHAWLTNDVTPSKTCTEVLASPKASYYPFYLKQGGGQLVTYMNNAELAGWKKYPIHKTLKQNKSPNDNEKVAVKFKPLPMGAKFKFEIKYHNLRKIEIGALLSALTFHNCDWAFHSVGMAKPLGYGKIKLSIFNKINIKDYLKLFEAYMNCELATNWCNTIQIKELLAMSCENDNLDEELTYMDLKAHPQIVKQNKYLTKYSHDVQGCDIQLCDDNTSSFQDSLEEDKHKFSLVGSIENVVHQFQKEEEQKLEVAFNQKKKELIEFLKEERKKRKEQEELEREAKRQEEKNKERQIIKEKGIWEFYEQKQPKWKFKEIQNFVEWYGREIHKCNNKKLFSNFPNGFINQEEDKNNLFKLLIQFKENANSKEQKELLKKENVVAQWLGKEQAAQLFNQLNK